MWFAVKNPMNMSALNVDANLNMGAFHITDTALLDVALNRTLTGNLLRRGVDNDYLAIFGGNSYPNSSLYLYGKDSATPGFAALYILNAAKTSWTPVFTVDGATDAPNLTLINTPTSAGHAATKAYVDGSAWGAWTPPLTWAGATPASVTKLGYYRQVNGRVEYTVYVTTNDSDATTGLTVGLPVAMANIGLDMEQSGIQVVQATQSLPYPYVENNSSNLKFRKFTTGVDGQLLSVSVSGFYPV